MKLGTSPSASSDHLRSSGFYSLKFCSGVFALALALFSCTGSPSEIQSDFYPGVFLSPPTSVVAVSSPQVLSGSSITVTLTLKDQNGNPFVSTLPNVSFQASGGTSTGSFGPVLNNGDGTYSALFTGVNAGTATMISPIVNGASVAGTFPSVTVVSGNFSLAQSTIAVSSASVTSGSGITVTLTAKDSSGNPNTSGGLTVLFSNSGGTSTGTFSATLDHGNGTYTSVFTGSSGGSSTLIQASIQGGMVTSSSPSVTVFDVAPSALTYSANPAIFTKGLAITNDTPSNSGGPVGSYSVSPALPAGLSLNGGTGVISGTPTSLQTATAYTVTATNTGGSTTASLSITVNDIAPSGLSYTASSSTYTKGTLISNNNPSNTGGSVLSYSVTPALPSGLSLSVMSGVISGTPTAVSSTTSYTVTATNTGGSTTAPLSITVIDVAPSALSYTLNSPTYTKGVAISANSPSSAGGQVTSYAVSPALPAGLSLNSSSGVISGTASVLSSAAVYTVTATNSGGSITASLNITVQDTSPTSLTYALSPVTFTKGSSASDSPANSGGAIASYSVSPALPAGLSLNTSTGVISGTPTVFTSATAYTITGTNTGGSTTVSLSITINDIAPSGLSYSTSPAVYTKNSAITNNTPASSGGSVVSYSISPALPTGLSLSSMTGVISGTPTVVSTATSYTITATNTGGSTTATLSITVNNIPPSTLTYAINPATYTLGTAISANTTSNSGGVITSYSVSPALPAGLSLNTSTGTVSGTPTAITANATYTVTGINSGGNVTASLIITVNDVAPSALTYVSASPAYTKNSAITPDTVTHAGGAVISYSVSPALPLGLSLDTSLGTVSGTPTSVTASSSYTVTALNSGGSTTATLTITVNDISPTGLSYSVASPTYTKGLAITNDTPSSTGGAVVTYAISPALPSGLSLSTTTGVISGTATVVSSTTSYTVTATNTGGSTTASLSITVNDVVASNLVYSSDPAVYTKGTAITQNSPTNSGGAITGYSVSPALPTGLSLNPSTGVITGTPTVISSATDYTISATNSGGTVTDVVTITVKDVSPSALSYSSNPATYIKGTAITNNTPTVSGGAITGYSVSPSLPTGLSLNTGTGVISGTPTAVTASSAYTVTATNSGGSTTASLTLTVNDIAPTNLTYSSSVATYTKGSAITSNTPSNTGGTVTSYSVSPALPLGLSLSATTGVISGTPTAITANASYTVTGTNSGGSTTASLSITVNDVAPSSLTYATNPATYTKSSVIGANNPSSSGGAVVSYSVSPALPAGLGLNTSTGVISGTPTAITSIASYTVTATNTGGSTTVSVSITVNDAAPTSLTYLANPVTYTKGYAITNNTASNTGGAITQYTVTPTLPAGLSLSMIAGTISGTPTAVTATQTYVVTATNSGGSTTANVSITVGNPTIAVSANNNQTAGARATLPSAFVAIVKDAAGTVIQNQLVDWSVTAGGGSVSSAQNATTAGGLSSSTMTLGGSAGSNTCTATIDGTSVSVTFTATATTSTFSHTFSMASSTGYTYNSSKIDFSNGYAELTPAYQTDNSSSCSTGFGDGVTSSCGGSSTGTAFSTATDGLGSSNYMMLSHAGTATDLELNSTWTPAWPNLVGYWKLNETSAGTASGGTDFADSSPGGTNAATHVGGVTFGVSGQLNKAVTFDGTSGYITAPNSGALNISGTNLTIAAWIYPTVLSGYVNSIISSYLQFSFEIYGTSGLTFADTGNWNYGNTGYFGTPVTNQWQHVAVTKNSSGYTFYINGQVVGSKAISSSITAQGGTLYIGRDKSGSSYYSKGNLDEVGIWNTTLSASAIATLYQHQVSKYAGTLTSRVMDGLSTNSWTTLAATTTLPFGKELPDTATTPSPSPMSESQSSYSSLSATQPLMQNLVGLWHLDEAAGTTGAGSVKDRSGNGNNGTPTGLTFGAPGKVGNAPIFPGTNGKGISLGTLNNYNSASTTECAWINPQPLASANPVIFSNYSSSTNESDFYWNTNATSVLYRQIVAGTTIFTLTSTLPIVPYNWNHVCMTGDSTANTTMLYVNGKFSNSVNHYVSVAYNSFCLGGRGCVDNPVIGSVDEAAIWNRALSANEVMQLYRRGANRIRYQVRSCPDSTCSTSPTWLGPDGSNQTYFSELNNNSIPKDGGDLTTSDSVSASSPTFTFSNFVTASPSPTPFSVPTNRYFQYRAIMESDDTSTSCNYGGSYTATWCSPELQSVAVGPNHYDTSNPTIVNSTGVNFATLTSLLETLGTAGCGSGTLYNLSPDGTNWYYLNGGTWTLAGGTVATATAASLITPSALSSFPSPGTVYFKVFLQSSGTSACTINSIAIGGTQ